MVVTEEMVKRNEDIKEELELYCKEKDGVHSDGSLDIGIMLYFLGFKIIEQQIEIEKLEERIGKLETKNYKCHCGPLK